MVNPPKEDTVRIRKLLEKFGAVGDANVFYWFQNRRSRSRRRQRQLQAAGSAASQVGSSISQEQASSSSYYSAPPPNYSSYSSPSSSSLYGFVSDDRIDDLYSVPQNPFEFSSDAPQLQYQPGAITVFINGVLTEVPRGAFDLRAMFGQNVVLVHSSGELVPVNEFGVLLQSLQMGESYFLVSST
ncbi:WUSCHEL-related homeobox 11-like isoform X2 [Canna indica]|uniref:WUSCHEL-related homeobox 11-like isoform X2 n=1 Tax=Canna indica TaxID=4628 RepID=A0AAQ3JVR6_9LILI|nr:WUSCHEL-related homeobox 11-like isoform X2 [Canna indica]